MIKAAICFVKAQNDYFISQRSGEILINSCDISVSV